MDAAFMRKTFALIAKGLIEKEQLLQKEPTRYPYSKALQHGMNMFLAASQWAGCQTTAQYADEAYSVYKAIYNLIDMQDEDHIRQSTLWAVLEGSCKSTDESFFNQMYRIWLNELGTDFLRPKQTKRFRLPF